MIGNSKTYKRNLQKLFNDYAKAAGYTINFYAITKYGYEINGETYTIDELKNGGDSDTIGGNHGGKTLCWNLKNDYDNISDYISRVKNDTGKGFDIAILQEATAVVSATNIDAACNDDSALTQNSSNSTYKNAVELIAKRLRYSNPNVEIYLRQTWGKSDGGDNYSTMRAQTAQALANTEEVASAIGAEVIRDGDAFYDAYTTYEYGVDSSSSDFIRIFIKNDTTHQSGYGAYLVDSCIYRTVFRDDSRIAYYPSTIDDYSTSSAKLKKLQNISIGSNNICKASVNYYNVTLYTRDDKSANNGTIVEQKGVRFYDSAAKTEVMLPSDLLGDKGQNDTHYNPVSIPERTATISYTNNVGATVSKGVTSKAFTFQGYWTGTSGTGVNYIDENGRLTNSADNSHFSSNGALYAKWKNPEITLPTITKKNYICNWTNGSETYSGGAKVTLTTDSTNFVANCEVDENSTFAISFAANPSAAGSLTAQSLTMRYGSVISTNDNITTVGSSQVTATAADGYQFKNWTNNCGNTVSKTCTITANFTKIVTPETVDKYTVEIATDPSNYGAVNKTSVEVEKGSTVSVSDNELTIGEEEIIATPTDETKYEFFTWDNTCGEQVESACRITAKFQTVPENYIVEIRANNSSFGLIKDSGGTEFSETSTSPQAAGSSVAISDNEIVIGTESYIASPKDGYQFVGWANGCGNTLSDNCTITANFAKNEVQNYEISFSAIPSGYGNISILDENGESVESVPVPEGTILEFGSEATIDINGYTITAQKTGDYEFSHWSSNCGNSNSDNAISENCSVFAIFSPVQDYFEVTVGVSSLDHGYIEDEEGTTDSVTIMVPADHGVVTENNIIKINLTDSTEEITAASLNGYTFSHWNNTCGESITHDCSVIAHYKSVEPRSEYTLTFIGNGGTDVPSAITCEVKTGDSCTGRIGTDIPTWEEDGVKYFFQGWSENEEALLPTYYPGDYVTLAMDEKLYAVFSEPDSGGYSWRQEHTHILNEGNDAIFMVDYDLSYFSDFIIDGESIDKEAYTVEEGSTIITLSKAYLDTLTPGEHTIIANYNINGEAVAVTSSFNIIEELSDITPPNTGENTNSEIGLNLQKGSIIVVIIAGISAVAYFRKKARISFKKK